MLQVLLSTQTGWFLWTPLTLLGAIGLVLGAGARLTSSGHRRLLLPAMRPRRFGYWTRPARSAKIAMWIRFSKSVACRGRHRQSGRGGAKLSEDSGVEVVLN
jgi:hypothetical protein